MNKTYKIVWSDTYQSWIACSELSPQKGKNTSTSKTGLAAPASVAAAVLAIAGIAGWSGNAQASSCRTGMPDQSTPPVGGECLVGQYNEQDNDNKKGSAIATESTPITLKSANLGDIRAANAAISSGKAKDLFTDPNIINQLNSLEEIQRNQQNNTINVLDPRSGSNQTVNVYRNIASSIAGDHVINAPTGKDIYVDLRLGTAQLGGKMIVDLGDKTQPANAAVNSTIRSPVLPAKQTRLIQADGGGSVEWISKNHIRFGQVTGSNGTIDVTLPIFKPKTITFQGTSYTLNTVDDLKNFNNDILIPAISRPGFANAGETLQNAYDRIFNEAAATENRQFSQSAALGAHPDAVAEIGERWVMAATGIGSTATLKSGGEIEQRVQGNGGGLLAESNGKVVIEEGAQLSGHFNNLVVRDRSSAENHGVISGGYFHTDGAATAANNYVEANTVQVHEGSTFDNSGIINVAGFTFPGSINTNYGISVDSNSTATNKTGGVINVGINQTPENGVNGVIVGDRGSFIAEAQSEIHIGRSAQYSKNAATSLVANASDQTGINVTGTNARVNHNGTITIHQDTQGATAVKVNSSDSGTLVQLGDQSQIDILGQAAGAGGGQPKQNVGVWAQNNGSAQITNSGAINVHGTNAVGIKAVAEEGKTSKVINTANSRISVRETSPNLITRNYGIYAEGAGTGQSAVTVDGRLDLQGNNVIGAHARGNATLTVNADAQTNFDGTLGATRQIGYHVSGKDAKAIVAALNNTVDVATEGSTLFRADDGGSVRAAKLDATVSGKNAIALFSNGKDSAASVQSDISVEDGTYRLTGDGSTLIKVSGGAAGNLNKGTVQLTVANATIGIADGAAYDLNNTAVPNSTETGTVLTSKLDTETTAAAATGYLAKNAGRVNYQGATLKLTGAGSTGFKLGDNDAGAASPNVPNTNTVSVSGATVEVNGDAFSAADSTAGANSENLAEISNKSTVTGSSTLFHSLSGTSRMTVDDSTVNGTITTAAGQSTVSLSNASVWNNNGNSTLTNLSVGGGSTVSFDAPAIAGVGNYKTITVGGNYQGGTAANPAKLVVNTYWNSDTDKDSDQLIVKGTATGNTVVSTRNGIIGNITQGTAQRFSSDVVTVDQPQANAAGQQLGQPDANAVFSGTANTTNAGQAQLVLRSTEGGKNIYAWTLYASTSPIVPPSPTPTPTPPVPGPTPPVPVPTPNPSWGQLHYIYADPVPAYVLMPQVNREITYNTLGTLHERRGENQTLAWDDCGRCGEQAKGQSWARIIGKRLDSDGKNRFNFESKQAGFQIGHDFAVRRNDKGGHNLTGIYLAYTRANTDFFDRYRAINAVVSSDKFSGKGKTDAVSLGVSNTYYSANGSYLDLVGQASWLRNRYQARDNAYAKQNGWAAALSAEVGRPFALGNHAENQGGWLLEPQAQLVYQYVGLKSFNDRIRHIDQHGQHSLRGRLGARLAYNGPSANLRTNTFYALANVWHDFIKPKSVSIGLDSVTENRNATWGEIGLGTQLPVGKNAYLYGDARYEHSFGKAKRQGYRGTIGFKYTWK